MINKISPIVQLSVGLVILTVSILLVAQMLGIAPGSSEKERVLARKYHAEYIAMQTTVALRRNDRQQISSLFAQVVKEASDVLSIGLRGNNALLAFETDQHGQLWTLPSSSDSTTDQVRIPLIINGMKQAYLEIVFTGLNESQKIFLGISNFIWLLVFVCVSGFALFYVFLRRTLKSLDPNSVVPARVRNALNTMVEGVLILDRRYQVVLVNDSFLSDFSLLESRVVGRSIKKIGLESEEQDELFVPPWEKAQDSGEKQIKTRMVFKKNDTSGQVFTVNSVPIADEKGNSLGTINSFNEVTQIESKNRMMKEMLRSLVDKQRAIQKKNRELKCLATRDSLTNCYNRRYLFEMLQKQFEMERKNQIGLCVIMVDIDYFKRVNDNYGHNVGDQVICGICDRVRVEIRKGDVFARLGGEEFCVVLPNTGMDQAMKIAEACRKRIEKTPIANINVTSSFGVSSLLFGASTPNQLIVQADQALYSSKECGRNLCTLWSQSLAEGTAQVPASSIVRRV